jgi:hypothetical protein
MSVEVRVLKLIKRVVYTRKRVNIFTRNFTKATVVNAKSKFVVGEVFCCRVAIDSSVSTRGTGTEVGR